MFMFQDIDDYIGQAKDKSYDTLMHFGRKGLNVAATAAVMAATKVMQTLGILFCPDHGVQQGVIVDDDIKPVMFAIHIIKQGN